jgi:hypothetical protein
MPGFFLHIQRMLLTISVRDRFNSANAKHGFSGEQDRNHVQSSPQLYTACSIRQDVDTKGLIANRDIGTWVVTERGREYARAYEEIRILLESPPLIQVH